MAYEDTSGGRRGSKPSKTTKQIFPKKRIKKRREKSRHAPFWNAANSCAGAVWTRIGRVRCRGSGGAGRDMGMG